MRRVALAAGLSIPTLLASPMLGTTQSGESTHETAAQQTSSSPEGEDQHAEGTKAEQQYKNTIRWATASEVDNFGFDVMRGNGEEGPFERLNETPIEGGGTTDSPRHYEFVDDTIDPRAVYYYYVESIALDGTREQFTPIAKVGPKIEDDEAEEETSGKESAEARDEPPLDR